MNDNLLRLAEAIKSNDGFAVLSHVSPDGDTLGSGAALCFLLRRLGKRCVHLCDGSIPENLQGFDVLTAHIGQPDGEYGTAIAVDCADRLRIGEYAGLFDRAGLKIVIDHHKTNSGFGDINYIKDYPATAQCITDLLSFMGQKPDDSIARCLYIAFLTDTGRFAYRGVTADTMEAVAELYRYGIETDKTCRELFSVRSYAKTKWLGCALEKLESWCEGRASAVYIDYETYMPFLSQGCDTEGIVNYAMDIKGCKIAVFGCEKTPGTVKVSLRSVSEKHDVAALVLGLGGGGHTQAAGCTLEMSCDEARTLFYNLMTDYFK